MKKKMEMEGKNEKEEGNERERMRKKMEMEGKNEKEEENGREE